MNLFGAAKKDPAQIYDHESIRANRLKAAIETNRKRFRKAFDECVKNLRENEIETLSDRLNQVLDFFLEPYSKADLLALRYQNSYKYGSRLIYLFRRALVVVEKHLGSQHPTTEIFRSNFNACKKALL